MSYLQEALLKKEKELNNLIIQTQQSLRDAPSGQLRISPKGNKVQYYYRTKETDGPFRNGQYIRKTNQDLAYQLAQRDYDRKLLEAAERELASVQKLLNGYHMEELSSVYEKMNPYRKEIVAPKVISDEMFAEKWKSLAFKGKPFKDDSPEIYTEKGERVRSKSEKIIADMLHRKGILYKYEAPLMLHGIGVVYPDFTILKLQERKEIYWEHLGMMDNPEYCEMALRKLNYYTKNEIYLGDRLMISHETSKRPLETAVIEKIIQANFKHF